MFRVLDLGCHDGFVSAWLSKQFAPGELHIDGIDANHHGVERARERLANLGVDGRFEVGLAENAREIFEAMTYDAVFAFEVLEHVPDMNSFLSDIECMCDTNGRVYLSTPDGVFGAGMNPHHLRAMRVMDVFDLCRRRGRVEDIAVGQDNISVVSYSPFVPMVQEEIAIHTGGGWQKWSPTDIESKGLGGSETAAVRLAEQFSEMGHVVTVYGEVEECAYKQVLFRHHSTFDPMDFRDLLVVSRMPTMFDMPLNATRKVLWMHDTDYGPQMTPDRTAKMDAIFVLSEWHRQHVVETYPWITGMDDLGNAHFQIKDPLRVTQNGIESSYFTTDEHDLKRNPHRAIYSSSPDRGLDFLLRWWPSVRERVPDAELYYCYSDVYDAVAQQQPELKKFRDELIELSQQDGVTNLGSLPQNALALAMRESGVWVHPSYCTPVNVPFMETYCIGAEEAKAAGCVTVGSEWGALAERSLDYPVPPDESGEPDEAAFVDSIVWAMTGEAEHTIAHPGPGPSWADTARDMLR